MSRAVIQDIVGEMADAFLGVGLADSGTYTAPGGTAVSCTVFISRLHEPFGDFGKVIGDADQVGLLLAQIPVPVRGGVVVADGNTFTLVRMVKQDEAISQWEVATA